MKKSVCALVGLVSLSLPTLGADLPPGPVANAPEPVGFDWTGFHAGIEGGGAWGLHSFAHPNGADTGSTLAGGLVGADLGYNLQFGAWVLGVEADLSWADVSGSAPCIDVRFICSAKVDWFGTGRARIGWARDQILPYVTGGLAYANVQRLGTGLGTSLTQDDVHVGWTAGAGVEYALAPNWSFRTEYLFLDLPNATYPAASLSANGLVIHYRQVDVDARFGVLRVGVGYKFDLGAPIATKY